MNNLASEILNIIILLVKDDQKTLTQLSLVSKAFYAVATPVLYNAPTFLEIDQLRLFTNTISVQQSAMVKAIDLKLVRRRWEINIGNILENLLRNTINVQQLNLGLCRMYATIIRNHYSLQILSLSGVRQVTDEIILTIIEHLINLIELDISGCNITDESIYAISKYCPNLESLDISGCDQISEEGIRFLTSECKHLRYINIKDCYNFVPMDGEDNDPHGIISNDSWVPEDGWVDDDESDY